MDRGEVRRARGDHETREPSPPQIHTLLSGALFLVLLAGEYTLARAGLPTVFGENLTERGVAALGLLVLALPAISTRRRRSRSWPLFLAPCYMLLSSLWAAGDMPRAALDLITLILLLSTVVLLVRVDTDNVVRVFMWLGFVAAVAFSAAGILSAGARASAFGGGPNVYSRITGMGVVCVIWLVGTRRLGARWLALIPLFMTATLLSGSRGGIAATLAAFALVGSAFCLRHAARALKGLFIAAGGALLASYFLADRVVAVVDERIVRLTIQEQHSSGRDVLALQAWDMISAHPYFGAGLGAYSARLPTGDVATYPHNMFLQHWAEGGILGLSILCASVIYVVSRLVRSRRDFTAAAVGAASLLFLVASQFSGDYYDQRFFYIYAVLLAATSIRSEKPHPGTLAERPDPSRQNV